MPYRKRSYKKTSRKTRRTPRYRTVENIVPSRHMVNLTYVDTITLNPGIATATNYIYRANSIFDPDFTAVGHQPLGHDQWAAFYDHYTVVGARMNVKFVSNLETVQGNAICGIHMKDNSTTIPDIRPLLEQPKSNYKILTNGDAGGTVSVNQNFSSKRFFGLKDVVDNRALIGAAFGANPTEDAYFHIYAAGTNAFVDSGTVDCIVTIDYVVMLTERKSLPVS